MSILQVIVLAVVQGLTEFLPVSSSAHLALAPWILGWKDQGLQFDIALHFGTLLAVVVYFFRDWTQIIAQGFGIQAGFDPELRRNRGLLWLLVLATIPVGVVGLLFKEAIETTLRSPLVMGSMLILVALLMNWADRNSQRQKSIEHINWIDALFIGAAQAVALIPGTSRSGITITAGLIQNLDRHAAARFSFLLSTPAVFAASAKAYLDLQKAGGLSADMRTSFAIGIVLSFLAGLGAIGFLMNYLRRSSLRVFVLYRIIFGIIVLALAVFRPSAG